MDKTPNFSLNLPEANRKNWTDLANNNFTLIDAMIASFTALSGLKGVWQNSFSYIVGDKAVDDTTGVIWTSNIAHVSSQFPKTFLQERTDNPTRWSPTSTPASNRGAWQTNTQYNLNDFVLADGNKYAMAIAAHVSGANFAADLALGRWSVLVDLSAAGSLVLPTLSGAVDANKFVVTNAVGLAYGISAADDALNLFTNSGSGPNIRQDLPTLDSPTLNSATVGTEAVSNDSGLAASTGFVWAFLRAGNINVQTFTSNGTYTPHAKMVLAAEIAIGGGGGGGGTANSGASSSQGGGGGGSGGWSITFVQRSDITPNQAVTIGAAGAGGAAGTNNGGAGGNTSIGALCTANGGGGGVGATAGNAAGGGTAGTAGTGDIAAPGNPGGGCDGGAAVGGRCMSGDGGSSIVGGGGLGTTPTVTGNAATGRGSGGSGGATFGGSGAAAGGAGLAGAVYVIELLSP